MAAGSRDRIPPLTLVASAQAEAESSDVGGASGNEAAARDLDWSILMARAQSGDGEAYRRLLIDIAPYLSSLARRHHRDPGDVQDTVQDVLLTVHAIRHTYDPHRPFGTWLVAIAKRRIIDRLRRQGRTRAREVALDLEHETFCAPEANLGGRDRAPAPGSARSCSFAQIAGDVIATGSGSKRHVRCSAEGGHASCAEEFEKDTHPVQ